MKKTAIILSLSLLSILPAAAAPSILDIKHSITDNNIVPPESFETKTRELEENFYLQNFVVRDNKDRGERLGTAREYEKRLASMPTEIEMPYNSIVGKYIDMYLGRRRGLVADMLALHGYYGNIFLEELLKEGVPTELQYLPVIESAINPNAVSRVGATGLWQFMPATAKGLGMEINSLVDERRDPRISSRNAARYLKQLHGIYDDWSLAIAAYNCGPGNVNKALRRAGGGKKDFWQIYNYLPKETRGYVPAFIAANYVMTFYGKHNIAPTVVRRQLVTDTIKVNKRVHFRQIADVLNIPVEEIRMLNPQYRQDIIPGNYRPYTLTLPKQQVLSYLMSEDAILAHDADLYARRSNVEPGDIEDNEAAALIDETGERNLSALERQSCNATENVTLAMAGTAEQVRQLTHTVGRGENIKDIAKHYGVSATDIKRWNKLRRGKVKEGDRLIIEQRQSVDPDKVRTVASPSVPAPARRDNTTSRSDVPAPPERRKAPADNRGEVPPPAARRQQEQAKPSTDTRAAEKKAAEKKLAEKKAAEKKAAERKRRQEQSKPKTYKVKSGDNLEKIAKANGTTVAAIQQANGMKKGDTRINIGETLKIPAKANAPARKKSTTGKSRNTKKRRR